MSEDQNIYSTLAKVLLFFNFLSLFFTLVMIMVYSFLEYVGLEILTIAENLLGASSVYYDAIIDLFELILEIPGGLDTLFMAIIIVAVMNIFYVAYKMPRGGWLGFFFFISLGLPIWLWIANQVIQIRNELLNYLNAVLVTKPETVFFDYFTNYSLEITAFIFLVALIIHMTDWENVRERVGAFNKDDSFQDDIEERFEQ